MVNIQSPTAEIRRGKKRRRKKEERNRIKIQWSALFHRATIKSEGWRLILLPSEGRPAIY